MSATVKVRIAVAVDKNGRWNSFGVDNMDDDELLDWASEIVEPDASHYWLEAELPIPSVPVYEASVTPSPATEESE